MLNKYFNEYVKSIFKKVLKTCNIYNGNSNKRKTDLIEMIVDRCTTNKAKNLVKIFKQIEQWAF